MDFENLKKSILTILSIWGIIFWIVGIGYMIYTGTSIFMWIVMAVVLLAPIIVLYYITRVTWHTPEIKKVN